MVDLVTVSQEQKNPPTKQQMLVKDYGGLSNCFPGAKKLHKPNSTKRKSFILIIIYLYSIHQHMSYPCYFPQSRNRVVAATHWNIWSHLVLNIINGPIVYKLCVAKKNRDTYILEDEFQCFYYTFNVCLFLATCLLL